MGGGAGASGGASGGAGSRGGATRQRGGAQSAGEAASAASEGERQRPPKASEIVESEMECPPLKRGGQYHANASKRDVGAYDLCAGSCWLEVGVTEALGILLGDRFAVRRAEVEARTVRAHGRRNRIGRGALIHEHAADGILCDVGIVGIEVLRI